MSLAAYTRDMVKRMMEKEGKDYEKDHEFREGAFIMLEWLSSDKRELEALRAYIKTIEDGDRRNAI